MKFVALATLAAWPIGYAVMRSWLRDFAYRTNIGWELFVLSAGLAMTASLAAVGYQSIKAALANPIDSLRNE